MIGNGCVGVEFALPWAMRCTVPSTEAAAAAGGRGGLLGAFDFGTDSLILVRGRGWVGGVNVIALLGGQ
jgi:hypothetical protein